MERDANRAAVRLSQSNLDVQLCPLHVFAEDPHFIEEISCQRFYIVIGLYLSYYFVSCLLGDAQCFQCLQVLVSIQIEYPPNIEFDAKLTEELLYFLLCFNPALFILVQK